jgi:hypothetical protein
MITFQPVVRESSVSDVLVIYLLECCILYLYHMVPLLKSFKVEAIYLVLKLIFRSNRNYGVHYSTNSKPHRV